MKFVSLILAGLFAFSAQAADVKPKEASKRIAAAAAVFGKLAQSGVEKLTVGKDLSIKEALNAVADKKGQDFNWAGPKDNAWEQDTSLYGSASMSDAYNYITVLDDDRREELQQKGKEREYAQVKKDIQDAKDAFETLLHTGVAFGVAPRGAVQCGSTLAALVVYDPHSGKVWIIAAEGSGC